MLANHAPASNDDSPQGDSDYDTILAALMETARGRSFLQEYALRNRATDTATLLTAIGRIEGLLTSRGLEPAGDTTIKDTEPAFPPGSIAGFEPEQPAGDAKPAPRDPFADIRALSDEEKIALFT